MSDNGHPRNLPAFPPGSRTSGVVLHVTSLPSLYGIGDLGPTALAWVDQPHDAGQAWWQSLLLGPTGYGNSPYQAPIFFTYYRLLDTNGRQEAAVANLENEAAQA